MNRILQNLKDKKDNFSTLHLEKIIYVTGVCGSITKDETVIGAKKVIILKCEVKNNKSQEKELTIYNSNHEYFSSILINDSDHVVAIREDFFNVAEAPAIMLGGFSNMHDRLICDLMLSINKSSTPEYLLAAIANLVAVEYREKSEKTKFQRVVEVVEENYLDENFSLEILAKKLFMSRRKLQYILASENVYFLDLVNSYRISHLKVLMKQESSHSLTTLTTESGFKNTSAANRVVKKHLNISLRELKNIIESSKNITYQSFN